MWLISSLLHMGLGPLCFLFSKLFVPAGQLAAVTCWECRLVHLKPPAVGPIMAPCGTELGGSALLCSASWPPGSSSTNMPAGWGHPCYSRRLLRTVKELESERVA